jgi:hypothetical protein
MALALLALLGQLYLGGVSTAHWAQRLTLQYMHSDICSAHGGQFAPEDDGGSPLPGTHGTACPVCSVAGNASAPGPQVPALALRPPLPQSLAWAPAAIAVPARTHERPPAQAPPLA